MLYHYLHVYHSPPPLPSLSLHLSLGMKSAVRDIAGKMLGNGQELSAPVIHVDQETLPLDRRQLNVYPTRIHSRSSSWSFTGSQRPNASDLGSSLASINPIRSVIREFVPSLDPTSEREVGHSPIITRTNSQISINLSSIGGDEGSGRNTGEASINRRSPSIVRDNSESSLSSGDNNREQPFADLLSAAIPVHNGTTIDDTGGSIELADWVKWIEQNAIFFLLFMLRYAWIQCAGTCSRERERERVCEIEGIIYVCYLHSTFFNRVTSNIRTVCYILSL